jgi:hypothetical protein
MRNERIYWQAMDAIENQPLSIDTSGSNSFVPGSEFLRLLLEVSSGLFERLVFLVLESVQ